MHESVSWNERVVLITGGTAGIGLALAEAFLGEGARIAVCGRSPEALEAFRRLYPAALAVKADVTVVAEQTMLLDTVTERFGKLDILVSNAGQLIERDFAAGLSDMIALADEITLNLTAPVQLTAATLARWPALEAVVIVSSGFALVSPARAPTYGAAKAGLHGFAEGLRRQLVGHGTHVLEVLPPSVDTRATKDKQGKKISPSEVAKQTLTALANKRSMVLPGQARFLPVLLRLVPVMTGRIIGRG